MGRTDVLLDWLDTVAARIKLVITHVPDAALHWRPDSVGNSIALTVWHIGRSWDVLACHVLRNQPAAQEAWHVNGWRAKTGYDPTGIHGFGNLYGYTFEETNAVPRLSSHELIAYLDEAHSDLRSELSKLDEAGLSAADGNASKYDWISNFIRDAYEHLGEIKALHAMLARQQELSLD